MKDFLKNLEKVYESRIRLGIMSVLMVNDQVDFNTLKELLSITDGNLASHLKVLEKKKLVSVRKQFIGRKPRTSYKATSTGKKSFNDHLEALERIIRNR